MKIFDKLKLSLGRKKEATTSPNSDPGEPLNPSPAEAELETEDPELECPIREPETPHSADPQPSTRVRRLVPRRRPPFKIRNSALRTCHSGSTLNSQPSTKTAPADRQSRQTPKRPPQPGQPVAR